MPKYKIGCSCASQGPRPRPRSWSTNHAHGRARRALVGVCGSRAACPCVCGGRARRGPTLQASTGVCGARAACPWPRLAHERLRCITKIIERLLYLFRAHHAPCPSGVCGACAQSSKRGMRLRACVPAPHAQASAWDVRASRAQHASLLGVTTHV
jgi:hypothetical protein